MIEMKSMEGDNELRELSEASLMDKSIPLQIFLKLRSSGLAYEIIVNPYDYFKLGI